MDVFLNRESIEKSVKTLRRKLREVEYLERLERPLNGPEIVKVNKKVEFRKQLQEHLTELEQIDTVDPDLDDSDEDTSMKRSSTGDSQIEDGSGGSTTKRPRTGQGDSQSTGDVTEAAAAEDEPTPAPSTSAPASTWSHKRFGVTSLLGHSDIVVAVEAEGDMVVTASRDTTVRVWNAATGEEVHCFGGHTGCVTSLRLLNKDDSDELLRCLTQQITGRARLPEDRLIISGSTDCSLRIWSTTKGTCLRSYYTYNGISCLTYISAEICIVSGTDGGKLEVWDAVEGLNQQSLHQFDDGFTSIRSEGCRIYTSSVEGLIKAWEFRDRQLRLLFSSEGVTMATGADLTLREIKSVAVFEESVFYGDEGANVKLVDWRSGTAKKIRNHVTENGLTDSVYTVGHLLLCSSYNLDMGLGSINFFRLPGAKYLGTLKDGDTRRILALTCTRTPEGARRVVSAGLEVKVWDEQPPQDRNTSSGRKVVYDTRYAQPARESDDDDSDDSGDDSDGRGKSERTSNLNRDSHPYESVGWKWCAIL